MDKINKTDYIKIKFCRSKDTTSEGNNISTHKGLYAGYTYKLLP